MSTIKKAAVIGAGIMGSGIAAHLANAGLDVRRKCLQAPSKPASSASSDRPTTSA
ncbi:3-hydroxyacyl-CoA dehydrogenase NAD-binding domain-containing protein [Ensifer sesbaniae]|uniref:3-hydroxyacyl-CoA dehydrogenase NAD-binding domain-containing protein n=1 Tax=Ensifer sesbaniae TaxID=1214071 RepID=UPI0028A155D3|nr:3-hydroxyacyl-CoA dehydrogenase NAD-binding domain-containing protein [Ensifer sesbaniae]NRQ12807.1 putative 3-hydroxyacyl-CoA dehydrogenase [Ensifer sesbaniae]